MSKFLFVVQGEGRGHLTQAISLYETLTQAGHEVVSVMMGSTNGRDIPDFFKEKVKADLQTFQSPSLVYGKSKSLQLYTTILKQSLRFRRYWASTQTLHEAVEKHKPDAIINFYDMVCGFYYLRFRPAVPCVCVGHQYLLLHKNFVSIPHNTIDRWLLNFNTKLTCIGASKLLGLSFMPMANDTKVKVTPPLLRQEVKALQTEEQPFLLAYTTHHRLSEDIIRWHQAHPEVRIHCFWDNKAFDEEWHYSKNLTFHRINAEKYLDMMRRCSGLVSTAGFESVCEAMYLGKPVMMVPVPNHIEQKINAFDGQRAGAGIASDAFDFSRMMEYLPVHQDIKQRFQSWQKQTSPIFLQEIESLIQPKAQAIYHFQKPLNQFPRRLIFQNRLSGLA